MVSTKRERDDEIIREAKERFRVCEEWEAQARTHYLNDYKFVNGDAYNNYQWPDVIYQDRVGGAIPRPCLTINKTMQHNLMIINDGKQNKPGVNIRPVGEEASFEAAQVFQEVVRHIEYISNAESIYDKAMEFQVHAGIGYWRLQTDYISNRSADQEIYIRPIKNPLTVYLDPDIKEDDGSDARYGFIFDDMDKGIFNDKYPKYKNEIGWSSTFDRAPDTWLNRTMIRVAEYYRKTQEPETLVIFNDPMTGEEVKAFMNELSEEGRDLFKRIKADDPELLNLTRQNTFDGSWHEREVLTDNIEWFKIAGDRIIERGPWLGKYIPIVRVVGTETIIDGILDRKGHTRTLLDPQRMYNYNSSSAIEFGALQTKSPWLTPFRAIENLEKYWNVANTSNFAYLPFNDIDEDGKEIKPPSRPAPPQASPAYVQGLQIAANEMMMASGQWQSQSGENENAKSGVAINARQRQGDRATYHFLDNQAKAIRYTGKQLIDLIPKIYDTKRVMRISASDGSIMDVTIDVNAEQPYEKLPPPQDGLPPQDNAQEISKIIFNPAVGEYAVVSEVGPSFATRRQEAFQALTQIAANNKEFMGIAGDVLWKVADFPEAQVLAQRWRKLIPKHITGDAPDPVTEQAMVEASTKIDELLSTIAKQTQELANADRNADILAYKAETERKVAATREQRLDYEAETKRLAALGNSGPAVSIEQIHPVVKQLIQGMLASGELPLEALGGAEPVGDGMDGGEPVDATSGDPVEDGGDTPPVEGAMKSPRDGQWYLEDGKGGYLRVDPPEQPNEPSVPTA